MTIKAIDELSANLIDTLFLIVKLANDTPVFSEIKRNRMAFTWRPDFSNRSRGTPIRRRTLGVAEAPTE